MAEDIDEGDPSHPAHCQFPRWVRLSLEDAETIEVFNTALSLAIRHADRLTDDDRAELADIAAAGWKRRRGRPADIDLKAHIFGTYILRAPGQSRPSRSEAINSIVAECAGTEHPLTPEAAAKAYDAARRGGWHRGKN